MIRTSFAAVAVPLPLFCLSGTLDGERPHVAPAQRCGGQTPVPAGNAADIAKLLTNDTITVATETTAPNQLSIKCQTVCRQVDLDWIRESILELAWPSPAYVQDVEVPSGDAAAVAKAISDGNKTLKLTAEAIGPAKIRLNSDSPVSQTDVNAIVDTYVFGISAPPSFRMFYQEASKVLQAMAPPPDPTAAAKPAATAASSPTPATKPAASTDDTSKDPASDPNAVQFKTQFDTTTSIKDAAAQKKPGGGTPPPAPAKPAPGGDGGNSTDAKTSPDTTTKTTSTVTYTPPPAKKADPPSPPAVNASMKAVNDNVVFTDTTNEALTWQRIRLLTILDLPRPEVLMNMWSYQASSPDGNDTLKSSEKLLDLVTAYNNALENSVAYGWAYLSRQMKLDALNMSAALAPPPTCPELGCKTAKPPTPSSRTRLELNSKGEFGLVESRETSAVLYPAHTFFDPDFYDYITQKFVADPAHCADPQCDPGSPFPNSERTRWGFCPQGKYCLGYTQAFEPVRPNLTSILMAAIAAKDPLNTILTTIGCMSGKYQVYGSECFPDRPLIGESIGDVVDNQMHPEMKNRPGLTPPGEMVTARERQNQIADLDYKIHEIEAAIINTLQAGGVNCPDCGEALEQIKQKLQKALLDLRNTKDKELGIQLGHVTVEGHVNDGPFKEYLDRVNREKDCLTRERNKRINEKSYREQLSCEKLDIIALQAEEACHLAQTVPLSCFTIQAAQSFSAPAEFSTFSLQDLNSLAEARLTDIPVPKGALPGSAYSAPRIGLLRAAVADFLFNYKMSQEFPKDFVPYDLQHSAQELNAELNPLVVAFNQDVAAFSRNLQSKMEGVSPNQTNFFQLWRNHKSFLSDGIITVRGIGGDPSTVDTVTQNYFDATQPVSLSDLASALTGQGGSGQAGASPIAGLESGVTAATLLPALAALVPKPTQAKIGRELYLQVTPYTLPGASSAELQVTLRADESGEPGLYQSGNSVGTDNLSRVARHDVTTRVRVESVKLFELSSFSAMLQRPRAKLPLVPPLVQLPGIGSLASLPLPGAKEYHRSTAVVSAVIVPTAADLAYGIDFAHDRYIAREEPESYGHGFQMRSIKSFSELGRAPIRAFHKAMTMCFATNGLLASPSGVPFNADPAARSCHNLTFRSVPPEF
jgi:hypothetical protein